MKTICSCSVIRSIILAWVLSLCHHDALGTVSYLVAPNANTSTEGNLANAFPFGTTIGFPVTLGIRYQQIYDKSQFASFTSPFKILGFALRPEAASFNPSTGAPLSLISSPFGPFVLSNVEIRLTTSPKAVDGLDLTFVNNLGTDTTLVYMGPITVVTSYTGPAGGPKDFDFIVNFTTPFMYDPSAGNLLMEIINPNSLLTPAGSVNPFFDAANAPVTAFPTADSVSRVYALDAAATVTTSSRRDTLGLVTRFTVPEPATTSILLTALLPLALRRTRAFPIRR